MWLHFPLYVAKKAKYAKKVPLGRLKHGQFLEWIEREFAWSEDSAQRFMRVHDHFKNRNLRNMEIDVSALYLIAAPSTPEPVRAQVRLREASVDPGRRVGRKRIPQAVHA